MYITEQVSKFFNQLGKITHFLYGHKTPDGVKHAITKKTFITKYNRGEFIRQLTKYDFQDHLDKKQTYYFVGSVGPYTLLMGDIDCHKKGTLQGAIQFAEYLKGFFPNLKYEVSTNGNGVHFYVIVKKEGISPKEYKLGIKHFQSWLRYQLSLNDFDIELVEVKGSTPDLVFDQYGKLLHVTYGSLAKLPRNLDTLNTEVVDLAWLSGLEFPKEISTTRTTHSKSNGGFCGSCSGKLFSDEELATRPVLKELAVEFVGEGGCHMKGGRLCTEENMADYLLLLKFFYLNPNEGHYLPQSRIYSLWKALYEAGEFDSAPNNEKLTLMRNLITKKGYIHWIDDRWKPPTQDEEGNKVNGVCCRWHISKQLFEEIEKRQQEAPLIHSEEMQEIEGEEEEENILSTQSLKLPPGRHAFRVPRMVWSTRTPNLLLLEHELGVRFSEEHEYQMAA